MVPIARKRRVSAAVKKAGADALLITHLPDVRYLSGFTGSSAALLLAGGNRATLFTDGRYTTQAEGEVDGAKIVIVVDKSAALAAMRARSRAGNYPLRLRARNHQHGGLRSLSRPRCPRKLRKSFFVPTGGIVATPARDQGRRRAGQDARRRRARLPPLRPGARIRRPRQHRDGNLHGARIHGAARGRRAHELRVHHRSAASAELCPTAKPPAPSCPNAASSSWTSASCSTATAPT